MTGTFTFTDAQKTDIRRYAGYGSIGDASATGSWRFFTNFGTLEYMLQHSSTEDGAVIVAHLGNCTTLEAAIYASSDNLDTDQAAVWYHNKKEVRDRKGLYDMCRRELCNFLGIPPGKALGADRITLVA